MNALDIALASFSFVATLAMGAVFYFLVKSQVQTKASKQPTTLGQWNAMPCGKRIELGATGFYITLHNQDMDATYRCHSPEHQYMASGNNLKLLKEYAETKALEREEFTPQQSPMGSIIGGQK